MLKDRADIQLRPLIIKQVSKSDRRLGIKLIGHYFKKNCAAMRMNNRTASIIANITGSLGQHVRPKIIIKKASRNIQTGFSPTTLALLLLLFLLVCVTLFFIGGIAWYFYRQKPEEEASLVPIEQDYQLDPLEYQFLEAMSSPTRQGVIMAKSGDIITSEEFNTLVKKTDCFKSLTAQKDGISDASTMSKTQSSQMGTLPTPELIDDKTISIIKLMQQGKKSFSLKLMSSSLEDID